MAQQKRLTAKRATTQELRKGRFFQKEGFEPNFLLTRDGRRISRARVVGTVTDKYRNDEDTYGAFTVEDQKGPIQVRFFKDLGDLEKASVGDVIEVAGKIRKYQGDVYLNCEMLKNVDVNKEMLHLLELEEWRLEWESLREEVKQLKEAGKSQSEIEKEMAGRLSENEIDSLLQSFSENFDESEETDKEMLEKEVIEAVEQNSDGEGADYADIIDEVDASEEKLESTINTLLSDGTFYEPQPGKIKKL